MGVTASPETSYVSCCSYGEISLGPALAVYYAKSAEYQRMADYLVGAAACWDIRSPVMLALGELEAHGPGTNWLGLSGTAIASFQSTWAASNFTGQPTPTSADITDTDVINAAAAAYWYQTKADGGQTDWQGLVSRGSAYNSNCSRPLPYTTGYGWSSMFLAYGSDYSTVDTMGYVGAFYVTGPTNTVTRYLLCGASQELPVPGPTTREKRITPYGRRNNQQIVILCADRVDQVSGWQAALNLGRVGAVQPLVTSDARFAAWCTQDPNICPIALGGPEVSAIQEQCQENGLSCTGFASFADWESSPSFGYVNSSGSTASDSYSLGNTAAQQANTAGW